MPRKQKEVVTQEPKRELLSISALSEQYGIDRATVRKRLRDIEPVEVKAKEKLYDAEEVAELLLAKDEDYEKLKRRKMQAEAELKELELRERLGEVASVDEFKDVVQKIFGNLHKRVAVQTPRKISGKLLNANSQSDIAEILRRELGQAFDDLRADWKQFL